MRGRRWLRVGIGPVAALAASFVLVGTVHAAGAVGTGTAGSCDEAAFDTAFAGGGTITFNCGPAPVTITFTSTKTLTADTTINGGGLITISGGGTLSLFFTIGFDLTLDGLVLRDAKSTNLGAVVEASNATVAIVDSTVIDNIASSGTAVALAAGSGTSTIAASGSTFVGNLTTKDGAIFSVAVTSFDGVACIGPGAEANVVVVNSTFTGNRSGGRGAILAMTIDPACPDVGNALVAYSTFAGNRSDDDLFNLVAGTENLEADLAANVIGPNEADCANGTGDFISLGYNVTDDASCFAATATGDQIVADTLLGPLADNGGPTQTIALLPGSAALDAIPNGSAECGNLPDDQRAIVRPQGTNCDAGAYEQVVLSDTATAPQSSGPMPTAPLLVAGLLLIGAAFGTTARRVRARP